MAREINMFVIYAREDKDVKLGLLRHLKPYRDAYKLSIWHDDHIEPGQQWKPHIDSRLNQTDIFLLLVSVDFINSEFIKQVEFKAAIDRHKENKSVVIPVIIDYCQWDLDIDLEEYTFNLKNLQVLPDEGKPIGDWKTPEQAFNNIAAGVRKVIISIKNNRGEMDVIETSEPEDPLVNSGTPLTDALDEKEELPQVSEPDEAKGVDISQNEQREVDIPLETETEIPAEENLNIKADISDKKVDSVEIRKFLGFKLSWVLVLVSIILVILIIFWFLNFIDKRTKWSDSILWAIWIFGTLLFSIYIIHRKLKK